MDRETVVCHCQEITLGEILDAIKNGATTVDAIGDETDAGTSCGCCKGEEECGSPYDVFIAEILEDPSKFEK